jgi:tetratricopeptide (TPR) repeat protein
MILRKLATAENKTVNLRRAIREYEQADYHFKAARNICFRADVKNNVAYVLRELSRLKEAHKSLEEARRLAVALRDKVKIAQIDDSRALIFMAQNRFKEAEIVSRSAASIMEKSGHQSLLADLLITHGTALARLRKTKEAQFTFQKAIEVSQQVGALNKAGLAALTLIEELDELSPQTFGAAYERANEWLAESQSPDLLRRINAAASKVLAKVQGELITESAADVLANKPLDFDQELLRYENALIKHALAQVNGSVTRAAANLSISYQKLAYIIETRHRDLLKERSPVRRRQRMEQ